MAPGAQAKAINIPAFTGIAAIPVDGPDDLDLDMFGS
ncbi:unnamed protein product, partial [Rotaria sp. Silwood1]